MLPAARRSTARHARPAFAAFEPVEPQSDMYRPLIAHRERSAEDRRRGGLIEMVMVHALDSSESSQLHPSQSSATSLSGEERASCVRTRTAER
eukprot:2360377-Prymnesium_polylepis.1